MEMRVDEVGDDLCVGCWGNPTKVGKVGGRFSVKIYRVNIEFEIAISGEQANFPLVSTLSKSDTKGGHER